VGVAEFSVGGGVCFRPSGAVLFFDTLKLLSSFNLLSKLLKRGTRMKDQPLEERNG
jgi:hypothetical protein